MFPSSYILEVTTLFHPSKHEKPLLGSHLGLEDIHSSFLANCSNFEFSSCLIVVLSQVKPCQTKVLLVVIALKHTLNSAVMCSKEGLGLWVTLSLSLIILTYLFIYYLVVYVLLLSGFFFHHMLLVVQVLLTPHIFFTSFSLLSNLAIRGGGNTKTGF